MQKMNDHHSDQQRPQQQKEQNDVHTKDNTQHTSIQEFKVNNDQSCSAKRPMVSKVVENPYIINKKKKVLNNSSCLSQSGRSNDFNLNMTSSVGRAIGNKGSVCIVKNPYSKKKSNNSINTSGTNSSSSSSNSNGDQNNQRMNIMTSSNHIQHQVKQQQQQQRQHEENLNASNIPRQCPSSTNNVGTSNKDHQQQYQLQTVVNHHVNKVVPKYANHENVVSKGPPSIANTSKLTNSSSSSSKLSSTEQTTVTTTTTNTTKSLSTETASKPKSKLPPLPSELLYNDERIKQVNDEYRLQLIKNADMNATLQNGWKLLPHQKSGILRALLMRRMILAFDMGLGKTLIGCVWAKSFIKTFPNLQVYIIAPVSLKAEWKKTATNATGLKCKEENPKTKKTKSNQDDSTKVNVDNNKYFDIEIYSWQKVPPMAPKSYSNYIVICDEAHNMQSMDSARTKDTLSLVLSDRCKGVLLLTGTPMKNGKPTNLFPLLKATRHPFGDDQRLFETFFCNGQQRNYGGRLVWDASGSSNLNILNAHITSHLFYKTKDDCLKDLPSKEREYKQVPVSSRFELQHNQALLDMAAVQRSLQSADNDSGNDAILGAFSRLRLIAAQAKIEAAVALAKDILLVEGSIVIFTNFVDVAKQVHSQLKVAGWKGELLVGETLASKRQAMVDNFQEGISPVFVTTFGAGGVGITLTAACTIILLDRPWTPGEALQAEDRIRRIGQTKPVKSIWLRAFEVDEQVDSLIDFKTMNSSAVMNKEHDSVNNRSQSVPRISIRKLVQSILDKNSKQLEQER